MSILAPGERLGRYTIAHLIGTGGMGEVYSALDTQLNRCVAVKVLKESAGDRLAALLHEARAAAALSHTHICTIHEVQAEAGLAFMIMELVEGHPLRELIPRDGLPVETVVRYCAEVASAVAHAHARGITHRDLKSSNVMITTDGQVKVLDFGLARRLSQDLLETMTRSSDVAGTLPYMSPEVLRGEPADAKGDIWSLGVLLYEAASGTLPFNGRTGFEVSAAIMHEPYTRLPARVPASLQAILDRCLSKDPRRRYSTAGELQAALEAIDAESKISAESGGPRTSGRRQRRRVAIRSIAVLPLENLSKDVAEEYFADGMTDALIASLAKVHALRVISRTSTMRYKDVRKPLPAIARELNVEAVLEGSAVRAGLRARITVQLIDAATDTHLWAQSYDRDMGDVLALQDEIANAVAREIQVALTPQDQHRLANVQRADPEAYELYLKGCHFSHRWTEESLLKAIEYLKQAIGRDPGYGPAYAALAESYAYMGTFGMLPPSDVNPPAMAAATKALEVDESLADAHTVLALLFAIQNWDWRRAGVVFRRALELNPNATTAHLLYALYLLAMGRNSAAIKEMQRAQQLDPLSAHVNSTLGWTYSWGGHVEQAVAQLYSTLEVDPHFGTAWFWLGDAHRELRQHEEAIQSYRRAVDLFAGPEMSVGLGHAYAVAGRHAEAREVLQGLIETSQRRNVTPYGIALIHAALDNTEQAFQWLERACDERSWWVMWLKVDPRLSQFQSDPRFQALLHRIGLTTGNLTRS